MPVQEKRKAFLSVFIVIVLVSLLYIGYFTFGEHFDIIIINIRGKDCARISGQGTCYVSKSGSFKRNVKQSLPSLLSQSHGNDVTKDKTVYTSTHTALDDIYFAVKTSRKYHKTRIKLLIGTWVSLVRHQTIQFKTMASGSSNTNSQGSIDLFQGSQPQDPELLDDVGEELPTIQRPETVSSRVLYEEISALRKSVEELKKEVGEIKLIVSEKLKMNTSNFQIEGSNVKKPLTNYLKSVFFTYPWLSEADDKLKRQMASILEGCGWEVNGSMLVTCYSFASHSFTNWRNQVRQKLVTSEKEVDKMNLRQLQRYLYSALWINPTEGEEQKNFRITIALRAFADGHKLFGKSSSATAMDFWGSFKRNIDSMMKQSPERWLQLEQRMLKKIEASNKED